MDKKFDFSKVSYIHEGIPGKLGTRMISFSQMGRRDLVDETGLIAGIYLNSTDEIERGDYVCETNVECIHGLIGLESRIHLAIDRDHRVYTMEELRAEDSDIVDLISTTNLRIVLCLKHKLAQISHLEIPEDAQPGRLVILPGAFTDEEEIAAPSRALKDRLNLNFGEIINIKDWPPKPKND